MINHFVVATAIAFFIGYNLTKREKLSNTTKIYENPCQLEGNGPYKSTKTLSKGLSDNVLCINPSPRTV